MATQAERAEKVRGLHWGGGGFHYSQTRGGGPAGGGRPARFEALATTSAGYAFSIGRLDGMVTLAEMIAHCRALCAATDLPVSADLENCFADDPKQAANTILLAAEAGVVGASIEDYSNDDSKPIYDFGLAVERVHAAVEAARSLGFPFTLTARAENLLRGRPDLDDTIRRLQAFRKLERTCSMRPR